MKSITAILLLTIVVTWAMAQPATIRLRAGDEKRVTIKAHSSDALFTDQGNFKYVDLESIDLHQNPHDESLYKKLGAAGVSITTGEHTKKYGTLHANPVNGDNIIVIKIDGKADSIYTVVGRRLVNSGFIIGTSNREFQQIQTAPKIMGQYSDLSYDLTLTISDGSVSVKPTIRTKGILGDYPWYYLKSKITKNHVVMNDIIKTFEGIGIILYDKTE